MIDKNKLAVIHIVKKELGLSDEEYRSILHQAVGVESAKELDEEKFRRLMAYFVRSPHYRLNSSGLTLRQKLYINHLVGVLGWDTRHLENFLFKYYHTRCIDGLTKQHAMKVIESLKGVVQHQRTI